MTGLFAVVLAAFCLGMLTGRTTQRRGIAAVRARLIRVAEAMDDAAEGRP